MCGLDEWKFDSEETSFPYDRFHVNFSTMTGYDFLTDG